MADQLYCDGVQDISIIGGVIRIDYFALSPTAKNADGKPAREFQKRVVMSPEAFLQSYGAMELIMNQLIERGLVTRREGADGGGDGGTPAAGVSSPNF